SHDDFDIRMLLQYLKPKGSLPGDHRIIIEGVNQGEAVLLALLHSLLIRLVVVRAMQHDLSAIRSRRRYFRQRSGQRHDDASSDFMASRVVGNSLRVITGGCRDHTPGALV